MVANHSVCFVHLDNVVQLGRISVNGLAQLQQVGESSPASSTRTCPSLLDLDYECSEGEL